MRKGTRVVTLRISENLKFKLERMAFEQDRSLNNLIAHILKEYSEKIKG